MESVFGVRDVIARPARGSAQPRPPSCPQLPGSDRLPRGGGGGGGRGGRRGLRGSFLDDGGDDSGRDGGSYPPCWPGKCSVALGVCGDTLDPLPASTATALPEANAC